MVEKCQCNIGVADKAMSCMARYCLLCCHYGIFALGGRGQMLNLNVSEVQMHIGLKRRWLYCWNLKFYMLIRITLLGSYVVIQFVDLKITQGSI